MAELYEDYFDRIYRAVGGVVRGAEQEAVTHEVFLKIMGNPSVRENFTGGSIAAWLSTLAHNRAVDFLRRARRETPVAPEIVADMADRSDASFETDAEARLLAERFRRQGMPAELEAVFDARFVRQLTQREAAAFLKISRTTLALREHRVRKLLNRFISQTESP